MGIDGGGTSLRVVVVDTNMQVLHQVQGETANPSIIGEAESAARIQQGVTMALHQAGVTQADVRAVGIGIAGASAVYAEDWLRATVRVILPGVFVAPSSDNEIALVGAHAARRGVLLLSGTGSVAFGINEAGESRQIGGWGYLMGDEGSGYWIGMEALRAIVRAQDQRSPDTALTTLVLEHLGLSHPVELIRWLYRGKDSPADAASRGVPRNREVAALSGLVMAAAESGDKVANRIIDTAAIELADHCRAVIRVLAIQDAHVGFAGGLLTNNTLLRQRVIDTFGSDVKIITPRYPPVVGAALLAKTLSNIQGHNS